MKKLLAIALIIVFTALTAGCHHGGRHGGGIGAPGHYKGAIGPGRR